MKRIAIRLSLVAFALVAGCESRPENEDGRGVETGFAEIDGARLYYEVAGSGDPIVLIHGGVGDHRHWDGQLEAMAEGHRVIRYDLRGYGRSSLPHGEPYGHHDDLKALLDNLGVSKAHVVGLSLGSAIAVNFVLAYPEMSSSLVSVGPFLDGYRSPNPRPRPSSSRQEIASIVREQGAKAAAEYFLNLPRIQERLRGIDPALLDATIQMVREYSFWHYVNEDPWRGLDPPAIDRLDQIGVPTLIVTAENDGQSGREVADLQEERIQGATKVVIPDAGHIMNMQRPDEFNRVVLDFFHAIRSRRGR
jgi:pimeloyl-ACP methyl ester carboxylesterase